MGAQAGVNDVYAAWDSFGNGVDPMKDDGTSANTTIRDTVQLRNPALYSMPATGGSAWILMLCLASCFMAIAFAGITLLGRR